MEETLQPIESSTTDANGKVDAPVTDPASLKCARCQQPITAFEPVLMVEARNVLMYQQSALCTSCAGEFASFMQQ